MLGLASALRLSERGERVTLFEAAESLGGLASQWRAGSIVWDRYYHVVLATDRRVRALLRELGVDGLVSWSPMRTGVYGDGRVHELSSARDLLRFPLLDPMTKARLAFTMLQGARWRDSRSLDDVPLEPWLRQRSGDRAFERFWRPLLIAKLGDGYREASAAFIQATIARLYSSRGAGLSQAGYGVLTGGYSYVLGRLQSLMRERRVEIRTGTPVLSVDRFPGDALRVVPVDGEARLFDRVVLTLPSPHAARVATALGPSERERLRRVRYQGVVCVSLLLRREPWPYYVTNIIDRDLPFSAVVVTSALAGTFAYGGNALVYLPRYAAPDDPDFDETDTALAARYVDGLLRMAPHLTRDDIVDVRVARARHVFALPVLGAARQRPPMQTSHPGLFIVNSAQIADATLNIEETLALAERGLEAIGATPLPTPAFALH
jgi:protoporphyrinogen oxidase